MVPGVRNRQLQFLLVISVAYFDVRARPHSRVVKGNLKRPTFRTHTNLTTINFHTNICIIPLLFSIQATHSNVSLALYAMCCVRTPEHTCPFQPWHSIAQEIYNTWSRPGHLFEPTAVAQMHLF